MTSNPMPRKNQSDANETKSKDTQRPIMYRLTKQHISSAAILLLIFTQSIGQAFNLRKILHLDPQRNPFNDLNEYLLSSTDSPEPSDNFQLIREKLLADESHSKNKQLIELARKFLALESINDENFCSPESLEVLDALSDPLRKTLSENPIQYVEKQDPGSERVVTLLVEYLKEYKLACLNETALVWNGKKVYFAAPPEEAELISSPSSSPPASPPRNQAPAEQQLPVVYALDDGYAELDRFLRAKVKTLDLRENINEASRLLKEEKDYLNENPAVKAAFEEFISLKKIKESNICKKKSADLANEVFESIGGRSSGKNPFDFPKSRKRIGEIVTHFFKERAMQCLQKYALEWDKVVGQHKGEMQQNLYVYKESISQHGKCELRSGLVITGEAEQLGCTIQRSRDHDMNELEDLNPIVNTFKELHDDGKHSLELLSSNRKVIEQNLDSVLYNHCKSLVKSKDSEALDKTFKTLLTVRLSDNLLRAARNHDPKLVDKFRNLVSWTTSYGNCVRLLGTDKRRLINGLYELSHQDVDQLLQETIVKFEDFPQTSRLQVK